MPAARSHSPINYGCMARIRELTRKNSCYRGIRPPPTRDAAMMPFAALALGSSLITLAADGVPILKVEPSCKAAGAVGLGMGRTAESCMNDEKAAREDLIKTWSTFSADDKTHCLSMI